MGQISVQSFQCYRCIDHEVSVGLKGPVVNRARHNDVAQAMRRNSSLRAFYFEPRKATNKVRDDAVHFVVGFEHQTREKNGGWKFRRWDLVDLSRFTVNLKAEFQGSNRDMYRAEAIVASSEK